MLTAEIKEDGVMVAAVVLEPRHTFLKGELYRGEARVRMGGYVIDLDIWASKTWLEKEK